MMLPLPSSRIMRENVSTLCNLGSSLPPSLLHAYKHAQIPSPSPFPPSSFQISPTHPQFPTTATTFFPRLWPWSKFTFFAVVEAGGEWKRETSLTYMLARGKGEGERKKLKRKPSSSGKKRGICHEILENNCIKLIYFSQNVTHQ